jgi:hypothetical protein
MADLAIPLPGRIVDIFTILLVPVAIGAHR